MSKAIQLTSSTTAAHNGCLLVRDINSSDNTQVTAYVDDRRWPEEILLIVNPVLP